MGLIETAFFVGERLKEKLKDKTFSKAHTIMEDGYLLLYFDNKLEEVIPTNGTHKDRHPITLEILDWE